MPESWISQLHPCRLRPPEAGQAHLATVLLGSLAMLVASAALGLLVNHFSPRGLPIFPKPQPEQPASLPLPSGLLPMTPDQAHAAFAAKASLFLDARSAQEYDKGHIPGALNLPARSFEARYPDLVERVEAAPSLVVYCQSIECDEAVEVADRLRGLVAKPIHVFEQGWGAWQAAGFPQKKADHP